MLIVALSQRSDLLNLGHEKCQMKFRLRLELIVIDKIALLFGWYCTFLVVSGPELN
jgi:hypothetical protein